MAPPNTKKTTSRSANRQETGRNARRRDGRSNTGASAANTHDVSASSSGGRRYPTRAKKSSSNNKGGANKSSLKSNAPSSSPKTTAKTSTAKSHPIYSVGDRVRSTAPRYGAQKWDATVEEVLGDDKYVLLFDIDNERMKISASRIKEKLSSEEESDDVISDADASKDVEDDELAPEDSSDDDANDSDEDDDSSDEDFGVASTKRSGRGSGNGARAKRRKSPPKSSAAAGKRARTADEAEVETPRPITREDALAAGGESLLGTRFVVFKAGTTPPRAERAVAMAHYFDPITQKVLSGVEAEALCLAVEEARVLGLHSFF